ncbi:hypothetical protein ACFYY8_31380 [Streptosporangium sp. NPDC001559]|uniref:hypothetical protein n=1 Tax=Streptosporangium sp. NPDC001559 TaxID=3366187 RepID=UPI0036EFF7C6
MTDSTNALTPEEEEVRAELARQDARWGEQNHPDGTGHPGDDRRANEARQMTQSMADLGDVSWRDILYEEVLEAFAETDPYKLLDELTQVEAVARQWRLAIRRRLAE